MPVISASVDAFLVTCIAVVAPTLYILRRRQASSQAPYRNWLTVLVNVHTVYIVYVLTIQWPPNLFQRLHIPLTMPANGIRNLLIQRAGLPSNATLPKPLEALLTRLSSFDTRSAYVRFGQNVLQDCQYCKTLDQYALYAIAAPLVEYIREAALVGLLTVTASHRGRWRTHAVVALVGAFLLESYFTASAQIHIPRDGMNVFMLHDNIWLLRQLFFLLLPIIVHSLPSATPLDPGATIMTTRTILETTMRRMAYLKFLRAAIFRDPTLRASASQWWDDQRVGGELVREDEDIQRTAEKLGSGYTEGIGEAKLLPRLREAAVQLRNNAFTRPPPSSPK